MSDLSSLLSSYITKRDNMAAVNRAQGSGLLAMTQNAGPFTFSQMVDDHAAMLSRALPELSLAEWEALAELSASRLNYMRTRLSNGN